MYEPMDYDAIKRLADWSGHDAATAVTGDEPAAAVSVAVPLEMLKSVIDALSVCAEDLETEVIARLANPASPTDLRRYHRDVEPAYNAKRLVVQLQELFHV
jgi:hypothetical protein